MPYQQDHYNYGPNFNFHGPPHPYGALRSTYLCYPNAPPTDGSNFTQLNPPNSKEIEIVDKNNSLFTNEASGSANATNAGFSIYF